MPRLFTGLEIPPDVAEELSFYQGGLFGARWIDEDFYHITLRFIGDVDIGTANLVYDELCRVSRDSFSVTLEGLTPFGGDRPRSLVASVRPSQPLTALQADHERAVRRAGVPPETRKFMPHVTLARLRGVSPEGVADYLTMRGRPEAVTFEASRFILYSSRDSVGGGPYVEEASFPLERVRQQMSARVAG